MLLYHPKYKVTVKNVDLRHRKKWVSMGFIVVPDIFLLKTTA